MSWIDNADNETRFLIERALIGATTFDELASVGANVTGFSNTDLEAGWTYSYRVRAENAGGSSAYSNVVTMTTPRLFRLPIPGDRFTCSIMAGPEAALCWGENELGQLGDGTTTDRPTPVAVVEGEPGAFRGFLAGVTTGGAHTCLTNGVAAYCWGRNTNGQLGDGTTTSHLTPVPVSGGLTFNTVSAGWVHNCGVTPEQTAYCWGGNEFGQLGDGTTTDRRTPVPVSGGLTFYPVSAGALHTCGVAAMRAVYCWGRNDRGQLGDGTTTDRSMPVLVSGGLAFGSISTGGRHTCGLTHDLVAYCWGANEFGQLGDGTSTDRSTPVLVSGGLKFGSISAGGLHTCGIGWQGGVYCWGANEFGQLGDGTTTDRSTPVAVPGGSNFSAVKAGLRSHTCGGTSEGPAFCWGNNESGGLGDGTTTTRLIPPVVVQP